LTSASRAASAWLFVVPAGLLAGLLAVAGDETNPLLPVVAVAGIAAIVLALLRPVWALYAAILLLPLESASSSAGSLTVTPAELMFYAAAGGWLTRKLASGDLSIRATPLTAPLALFVVSIVPGLLIASDVGLVVKQLATQALIFVCFLLFTTEGEEKDILRMPVVISLVAAVVGMIAIASPPVASTVQTAGPLGQVNTLGEFLAIAVPIQLALAIGYRGRIRLLMLACGLITLAGLTYSGSRGSFIGLAAMFIVFLAWRPFRYIAAVGTALLVALALLNFGPLGGATQLKDLKDRILRLGSGADESSTQRLDAYKKTPEMIADHPLFGVGAANYRFSAPTYHINFPGATGPFGNPHDTPLQIGAERGIIGLVALAWVVFALFRLCGRILQRAPPRWRPLAYGIAGTFASQAIILLFECGLPASPITLELVCLAGVACLMDRAISSDRLEQASEEAGPPEQRPGDIPADPSFVPA
jgi:O-antigen ligase